ncbi:MAG: LysM domain-containing protein [Thermoanaerobaculia bacterium]|nr:LysM domain-containing protein [Thermoanaerobaculia bacterium]
MLCAPAAGLAQRPPTDLHYVQDHWTAWDPPTSLPEGAQVHLVEPGDTLWDLAQRYYGDPYLWPQIWERNQWVRDAHWIYPGDPLLVGIEATPVSELEAQAQDLERQARTTAPSDDEGGRLAGVGAFSGSPEPLGSEADVYCSGFLGADQEPFSNTIIGSEYENLTPNLGAARATTASGIYGKTATIKYGLSTGDIVYVDGGLAGGLYPGQVLTVVTTGDRAVHPVTGTVMGRYYDYRGRVRLLSVQDETAIAEIIFACDPINVGDRLEAFEPIPIPLGRRTPMRGVNDPVSRSSLAEAPTILRSRRNLVSLGRGHLVYMELDGSRNQAPGDIYSIYRPSAPGLPPVLIGELAVLTVRGRSAVGKILESRYTVHVGDRLSFKAP